MTLARPRRGSALKFVMSPFDVVVKSCSMRKDKRKGD